MSREIKFKVWDSKKSGWNNNVKIDMDGSLYPMNDKNEYDWSVDCLSLVVVFYTGLKDKNGVEIYEGDILVGMLNGDTSTPDNESAFSVSFSNGSYNIGIESETDYLVIGNIYQNPELLNF